MKEASCKRGDILTTQKLTGSLISGLIKGVIRCLIHNSRHCELKEGGRNWLEELFPGIVRVHYAGKSSETMVTSAETGLDAVLTGLLIRVSEHTLVAPTPTKLLSKLAFSQFT